MSLLPTWRVIPQPLPGVAVVELGVHRDDRGAFVKTFHATAMAKLGWRFELREEFFSVSHRGVLRGMHFQLPPHDHQKLVSCTRGRVLDVLLDLRQGSPAFGRYSAIELNEATPQVLVAPCGLAHGFLSLEDQSCVNNKTDGEYSPQHDVGVRWDSFGFDWPMAAGDLIISPRDRQLPPLAEFRSPFHYCHSAAA
jgi:dTDP-4-dehydrorhamnose 3,5-epimerase